MSRRRNNKRTKTYCEKVLAADDGKQLCCWWSLPVAVSTVTPSAVSTMLRLRRITSLSSSTLTTSAGDVMTTGGGAGKPPPAADAAGCWDVGSHSRTSLLPVGLVMDTDGGVNGFRLYMSLSAHAQNAIKPAITSKQASRLRIYNDIENNRTSRLNTGPSHTRRQRFHHR